MIIQIKKYFNISIPQKELLAYQLNKLLTILSYPRKIHKLIKALIKKILLRSIIILLSFLIKKKKGTVFQKKFQLKLLVEIINNKLDKIFNKTVLIIRKYIKRSNILLINKTTKGKMIY